MCRGVIVFLDLRGLQIVTVSGGVWRINDAFSILKDWRSQGYMQVSTTPKKQEDADDDNFYQTYYYEKEARNYSVYLFKTNDIQKLLKYLEAGSGRGPGQLQTKGEINEKQASRNTFLQRLCLVCYGQPPYTQKTHGR